MAHREKKLDSRVVYGCFVVHNSPTVAAAEQYRRIRNNIRIAAGKKEPLSLVVTSPSPGEGKTTSAANLALSFAQRGDKVLLVDANVRSPVLGQVFGIKQWPGLSDGLASRTHFEEIVYRTDIERLSVIPGGSPLPGTADLLDSQAMSEFLDRARQEYTVILFDCPAVLETPDAVALAGRCDGAVLVVSSGRTKQKQAAEAKRLLDFGRVRILGSLLNRG
ncbi:capsular exopolysaccharide synthesis family protein [Paenibacillus forsythiae]|uniref:non-specific protein-tyrosine kinase n=1 Tax=Paenibacillus forsythiae TaxID=365616 RepID=A0ABU3HDC3_9BACL|nr:CpsD/CapB family tyrosine-protein kinase [Paenibacillus forsythiae]MDT3428814.1 capsular exopolysaccharide synthesis family protein [Paenibacillus forsythiae]